MRSSLSSLLVAALIFSTACAEDQQNLGTMAAGGPGANAGAAGSGQAGSSLAGSSQAGGQAGSGQAGSGQAGSGQAGSEQAGSGQAGAEQAGGQGGGSGQAGEQAGGSGQAGEQAGGSGQAGEPGAGGQAGSGQAGGGQAGSSGQAGGGQAGSGQAGAAGGSGYFARFLFQSGQETVGDFCAAYALDGNNFPVWDKPGLLAASGVKAADFDGLKLMTAYLPIAGKPVAFGFTYPGQDCSSALGYYSGLTDTTVASDVTHFTVLSVPYSGEPNVVWAVGDPVEINEAPETGAGVRVVNATAQADSFDITLEGTLQEKVSLGSIPFGNSPSAYTPLEADSLVSTKVTNQQGSLTLDWTTLDLLPIRPRRTIYLLGLGPSGGFGTLDALACLDTRDAQPGGPIASACFPVLQTGQ